MKCPIDNSPLTMTERHGVEIDYCPTCRGVWLDRGELDKILDRAAAERQPAVALAEPGRTAAEDPRAADAAAREAARRRRRDDDDDDDDDRRDRRRPKRRESFLSDLFDF